VGVADYTEIVPDCKKKTLQQIIIWSKFSADSVSYSDGWLGYNGLFDEGVLQTLSSTSW
jgi:hypothetical protein